MAKEQFSDRWGIVLASLGMAIGAGNLWRFPRLAGQYGGTFIILWILFLFIWSIPLLITEFGMGSKYRSGVIGSFANFIGKKYTWMGFFVTICTLGIAFYYAIVTAWAFRYLSFSVGNLFWNVPLKERMEENPELMLQFWDMTSNGSWFTVVIYILVIFVAVFILKKGVKNGLERANRLLIPSLFVLLLIIITVSLNVEGGVRGLEYMFEINPEYFYVPKVWIEALSQSAWSTGAGWGLMLTLSGFSRDKEDITLNTFIGALGNNTASLLSGMAVLPAVFALAASDKEAIEFLQSGNQALTFTFIPELFSGMPGGELLAIIFFLALTVAAFTSLLPMIELLLQNMADININKKLISLIVVVCFIVFGFPSAWSIDFFTNQDWVWGVGLILSGLLFLMAVAIYGPSKFKMENVDPTSDIKLSPLFFKSAIYGNIALGIILIYWWMSQGYSSNPWFTDEGYWNIIDVYSNATILTQWGIVLLAGLLFNKFLYNKFVK